MELGIKESHVFEFHRQRTQGLRRDYKVMLNVTRLPSGAYAYQSWVHHNGIFKGNGLVFPLVSADLDSALSDIGGPVPMWSQGRIRRSLQRSN